MQDTELLSQLFDDDDREAGKEKDKTEVEDEEDVVVTKAVGSVMDPKSMRGLAGCCGFFCVYLDVLR